MAKKTNAQQYTRREMLALGGSSLATAGLCLQGCRENKLTASRKPNVLVFLADALRADHLGCYGYPWNTSPRIDAMAQSGILFERCYSEASWTKPAIGALFTGYTPRVHQAVLTTWKTKALDTWEPDTPMDYDVQILRGTFTTLAQSFENLGYDTALFQSNPHCQQEFGFGQGFHHYRYVSSELPELQVDAVLDWLMQEGETPFFLFVHEIDPHGPYTPEEDIYLQLRGDALDLSREDLSEADRDILAGFRLRYKRGSIFDMTRLRDLSPRALDYLISLYDAEIRGVDYHFGRILDYLAASGLDEDTIVVFISDHGQAFGEHGFFAHNSSLYEEELRVPMIIRPGTNHPGIRIPWNINLHDLFPTLITLAGGVADPDMQAKSLLTREGEPLVSGHRPVYAYFDRNREDTSSWEFCIIEDGFKVYDKAHEGAWEIYDRAEDPGEKTNLVGEIAQTDALIAHARSVRAKHRALAEKFGEPEYAGTDDETLEELRALGYL